MKCDIVFLAHGRPEFTAASLEALRVNTNWDRVKSLSIYTDGAPSLEETQRAQEAIGPWVYGSANVVMRELGGPVNIMNHYLAHHPAPVWAKIDNDVIVPPGWLDAGLMVMEHHPELSFLGLEPPASRTRSPYGGKLPAPPEHVLLSKFAELELPCRGTYARCDAIGGVGFMRTSAWRGRPQMEQHSTYGGFTDWQIRQRDLVKGWICPPLKLFLLDRLPIEPWASLSKKYEAAGQQRFWTRYPMEAAPSLWEWWL